MNDWRIARATVAEVKRVSVTGEPAAGACRLVFTLAHTIHPIGDGPRWLIRPTVADIEVALPPRALPFVRAAPYASNVALAPTRTVRDFDLQYAAIIDHSTLAAVEASRNGRDLPLVFWLYGDLYIDGVHRPDAVSLSAPLTLPAKDWTSALMAAGYGEFIHLEFAVPKTPGGEALRAALSRLTDAHREREDGHHPDAVVKCRMVLDALDQASFGGHAPADVVNFIKTRANQLTVQERAAVVRAALAVYFSPAAHGEMAFDRDDSGFSLAATAALLKLAPHRLLISSPGAGPHPPVSP